MVTWQAKVIVLVKSIELKAFITLRFQLVELPLNLHKAWNFGVGADFAT